MDKDTSQPATAKAYRKPEYFTHHIPPSFSLVVEWGWCIQWL